MFLFLVGPSKVELSGPSAVEAGPQQAVQYECRTGGADPAAHLEWTLLDRTGVELTHLLKVLANVQLFDTETRKVIYIDV